jgi:hypothetical protein
MFYDESMNSECSMQGEQPNAQYTPEQLAAIRALDEPSTTTSRRAISKSAEFAAMATGALVVCAFCKFLHPALMPMLTITAFPGGLAAIYVGRRIIFGRPLKNKRSLILYAFLLGMLVASGLWGLRHLP